LSRPVVIVLAGGISSRLWPLRDKLFLEFGSQTLLERHVRMLSALGCERFVVVVRPEGAERVQAMLGLPGIEVRLAQQPEARGMADAVLRTRPALDALGDQPIYVTQAHDVVDPEMHQRLLDAWENTGGLEGVLAASRVDGYFPGGYLRLAGNRVIGVLEKPGPGNQPSDLVNLVAHVFRSWRRLLAACESELYRPDPPAALTARFREHLDQPGAAPPLDDAYERALTRLMAAGEFRASVYEGRWQALKFPWHVLDVMDLLLESWTRGRESPGEGYEQREDGVFIGRDVRLLPGAHLSAPALIGHGCVIGNNALVRGSLVSPRCVVGFGSEVARSYLGEGCQLHHNYVGDSVLERDVLFGFGTITANFRLDERNVKSLVKGERIDTARTKLGLIAGAGAKIGVGTNVMPGVKIGAGAIVGPGQVVQSDVGDGERLLPPRGGNGQ